MDKIAVIDLGGQYCHLIARRVRDLGVFSEILSHDVNLSELSNFKGVILSGGPGSVYDKNAPQISQSLASCNVPLLGLCYGHQILAKLFGGNVKAASEREFGKTELAVLDKTSIFKGLDDTEIVWMSHGDHVESLPNEAKAIGSTKNSPNAAFEVPAKRIFGLQFHIEVTHTVHGMKILDNFLSTCNTSRDWKIKDFANQKIREVKHEANDKNVFLLVSGGVDSSVCFALLNNALGKHRVKGIHIDHGLERLDEAKEVKRDLYDSGFDNLEVFDASSDFLNALKDKYDPEEKRKIIGDTFIKVQQKIFANLNLDSDKWLLGQGTIYPDTIETGGTKNSAIIKTHHNRVEIIRQLIAQGRIIEPIKELYKDEVRLLGKSLGLPDSLVSRHPFPGPGLGVRIICAQKEILPKQETIRKVQDTARSFGYSSGVLPIRSVGVQGDFRTYMQPAVLSGKLNWSALDKASTKITNSIKEINRVIYSISSVDPSTLVFKPGYLTRHRIQMLQQADSIVTRVLKNKGLYDKIWQFPVVLLPLGSKGGESIVLRPVHSTEAMTASFYELEEEILTLMRDKISEIDGLDEVFFDVTHKPPATIEWE